MYTIITLVVVILLSSNDGGSVMSSSVDVNHGENNIILTKKSNDNALLYMNESPMYTKDMTVQKSISIHSIGDMITHAFGLGSNPLNRFNRDNKNAKNFLTKPRANVLITIDSLGSKALFTSPHLNAMKRPHDYSVISDISEPKINNIMTSKIASTSNMNVADRMKRSFPKSLILSTSANPKLALSYSMNPLNARTLVNNVCVALTNEHEFTDVYGDVRFQAMASDMNVQTWIDALKSRINDYDENEWKELLMELAYFSSLPSRIMNNDGLRTLVNDNEPDLYFITFASLESIYNTYGSDSNEYGTAVKLIHACSAQILKDFEHMYPSRLLSEYVLLGINDELTLSQAEEDEIMPKLTRILNDVHHHATTTTIQSEWKFNDDVFDHVCNEYKHVFKPYDVNVYCMKKQVPRQQHEDNVNVFMEEAATAPSEADINQYQVILWISILLSLAVLWAVYATMFMDMKRDTLIYGKFNPNWAKKNH